MTFGAETRFHSWFATSVYGITGIIEPAHAYDRHFVHRSYTLVLWWFCRDTAMPTQAMNCLLLGKFHQTWSLYEALRGIAQATGRRTGLRWGTQKSKCWASHNYPALLYTDGLRNTVWGGVGNIVPLILEEKWRGNASSPSWRCWSRRITWGRNVEQARYATLVNNGKSVSKPPCWKRFNMQRRIEKDKSRESVADGGACMREQNECTHHHADWRGVNPAYLS